MMILLDITKFQIFSELIDWHCQWGKIKGKGMATIHH